MLAEEILSVETAVYRQRIFQIETRTLEGWGALFYPSWVVDTRWRSYSPSRLSLLLAIPQILYDTSFQAIPTLL